MGTEIARHLRTIHFSLVLACILILISLFVSSPTKVKTAHNQLQKILSMNTNWNTWTRGFCREQITWLKQHGLTWSNTVRSEFYILPEALNLFGSRWGTEFNEYFCGVARQAGKFLFLPAMGRSVDLPTNLRIWLAEEFNFPTVSGKFEETFPELNEITKHYQKLELNDANQILGAELQRTGERIEFLGLKFPESFISTWGAVILLIIQLYFWLHLRTFYEYLASSETGIDVAWIGIYSDFWSRVISLITVSLLPVVIVGYLVFWGDWFSWKSWFSWFLIPLFMVLELLLVYSSAIMMMAHSTSNHTRDLLSGWVNRNHEKSS
jgi:hypothetical protein